MRERERERERERKRDRERSCSILFQDSSTDSHETNVSESYCLNTRIVSVPFYNPAIAIGKLFHAV